VRLDLPALLVDLGSLSLCGMFSLSAAVLPLVLLPVLVLLVVVTAGVWLITGVGVGFKILGDDLSATSAGGGQSLDNIVQNFSRYFRFCRPVTFYVTKDKNCCIIIV